MIVMCFKKHLIFGDDPLFLDGKDFGDVSRQNVIMIVYLSKSHVVVKCGEMDASACEVSDVTFLRLVSFRLLRLSAK